MIDIKPCPFCGGEADYYGDHIEAAGFMVECNDCDVRTTRYGTLDRAIAAWNRRAPQPIQGFDAKTARRLEAIRERCDEATEGPWSWFDIDANGADAEALCNPKDVTMGPDGRKRASDTILESYDFESYSSGIDSLADDREFIANSREDIPFLLDLVADLVAENAELRDARVRAGR